MDDFGNIIYVIAAIGWFFWNAYEKSQDGRPDGQPKSAPQPQPKSKRKTAFDTLEELIKEQMGEEVTREPEPVVAKPEPIQRKQRNRDKFLNLDRTHQHLSDDYVMSVGESGSHRVQRQVTRLKTEASIEEKSVMDELFPNDGFDLRKAVVLNAILERPYKWMD